MENSCQSQCQSKPLSLAVMFLGFALLSYLGFWWPGIMFVLALSGAVRAMMEGQSNSAYIGPAVLAAIGVVSMYGVNLSMFSSVGTDIIVFGALGLYMLFKSFK